MDTFLSIYHSIPPFVWGFIFGTPFIVGFVNVLKKVFGVNSTLVIHTLTTTTSVLLTLLPEIITHNPKPGAYNIAFVTAFFTFANFLYAASKKLQPFLDAVQAYEDRRNAAKESTLAPATAASVSSTAGPIATPAVTQIPVSDPTEFEG